MIGEAGPPTAEKRLHFITAARPTAVPPALLTLAPDAVISEERRIGRQIRYCGAFGADDYREEIEERIARQSEDLFTVNEAAQVLADSKSGKSGPEWVKELRAAHRAGALAIRDSSSRIPYKPTHPSVHAVIPNKWTATENESGRDFLDLVRGEDVDAWLRESAGYGFPSLDADANTADNAGLVKSHQAAQGSIDREVRTHRVARDLLTPVIERACNLVDNKDDAAAVMAELERLARLPEKDRPAPLAGVTSGGIQWRDGGTLNTLSRKALGDRMRRRAKPRQAAQGLGQARR